MREFHQIFHAAPLCRNVSTIAQTQNASSSARLTPQTLPKGAPNRQHPDLPQQIPGGMQSPRCGAVTAEQERGPVFVEVLGDQIGVNPARCAAPSWPAQLGRQGTDSGSDPGPGLPFRSEGSGRTDRQPSEVPQRCGRPRCRGLPGSRDSWSGLRARRQRAQVS